MTRRVLGLVVLASGCIIPDRDIRIDPGLENVGAVRIVQRAPRDPEMDALCNAEDGELAFCPEVPRARPSGLVTADGGDFCVCPQGTDGRAIPAFDIFAEDADREGGAPKDTLYGALLLDPDPRSSTPYNAVAFGNYWEPCAAGEVVPVEDGTPGDRTAASPGRRPIDLWRFRLEAPGSDTIDLCNDNHGEALAPGLHDLRFMVTDREFFRPPRPEDGDDGEQFFPRQCGVPDLAAGATYAVIDFVFECKDGTDPAAFCDCTDEEGG